MNHKRKKPRRQVAPHRCRMCMLGAPKRKNGKDRMPHRDKKRTVET